MISSVTTTTDLKVVLVTPVAVPDRDCSTAGFVAGDDALIIGSGHETTHVLYTGHTALVERGWLQICPVVSGRARIDRCTRMSVRDLNVAGCLATDSMHTAQIGGEHSTSLLERTMGLRYPQHRNWITPVSLCVAHVSV